MEQPNIQPEIKPVPDKPEVKPVPAPQVPNPDTHPEITPGTKDPQPAQAPNEVPQPPHER